MAASRTSLFLLGLVVLATVCAAVEATAPAECKCGSGGAVDLVDVKLKLDVNLKKCEPALRVLVDGVVKVADRAKALRVCAGRKVTSLAPLAVHLKVNGVVNVNVEVLGKDGKPALKAVVKLDLAKLAVKVVDGVHHLVLDVVHDAKKAQLVFSCLGKQVHAIDIRAHLDVLGLVNVGVGVGVGIGRP
ncbi:hypothetical protein KC19_11G075300 [Ceratodon purpureus]|uniref:Uncharacterized protein n=1 Tax=Ceratodon purpureus TaxID=3225 RepID=A0A8T0GF04_CERPU|nr:hypothetical protein KC19_11G075300 [Ceratodon purpureus]